MDKCYILDITTLITLISDICNDKEISRRFGSIDVWKSKNKSIYDHIIDDQNDPVFPKLIKILENGKLYTTKLAWNKFYEMIDMYGSKREKEKLSELKVELIDDDISVEFEQVTGKLWSKENKSIIGTASKNGYIFVTGNINVLSSALEIDSELKYVAHRSRCFVGKRFEV